MDQFQSMRTRFTVLMVSHLASIYAFMNPPSCGPRLYPLSSKLFVHLYQITRSEILNGNYNTNYLPLGFSISAGYDALLGGSCTSCEVAQDKSAYWTPALYFKSSTTGEYTLVQQVGGMLA